MEDEPIHARPPPLPMKLCDDSETLVNTLRTVNIQRVVLSFTWVSHCCQIAEMPRFYQIWCSVSLKMFIFYLISFVMWQNFSCNKTLQSANNFFINMQQEAFDKSCKVIDLACDQQLSS